MYKVLQIILKGKLHKGSFIIFALIYFILASFQPTPALSEGNPFVPTTDTMQTGLTAQVGSNSLFTASQNIANFTDITGAYYDATLNRIVFIGITAGSGPKFNKDDMAVAIQSIFFNNIMPDVNIGDDPSNPGSSTAVVTYTGAIQNTNLGNVLFNSDYKLKQYVIGYDLNNTKITSTVPTYKSVVDRYVALDPNPVSGNQTKFILSPQVATLKNSPSANAFVFLNLSMQATAQHTNPTNDAQWNQASSDFVSDITTNYDQYAQETTSLAQAKQIAKIVSILKWITDNNISTDFHWAQNYTPQVVSSPPTVLKVTSPVLPNGYSAQGQISFTTPNTYVPDDGIAASLKSSSQAVSTSKVDITWTFTNGGQQYQAVAVTADAFKSLGGYSTSVVDMEIPIAGDLSLSLQRTYSSFSNAQFGIGLGWEFIPARLYPNSTLQDLDIVLCNDVFFFTKLAIDTENGHETFTFSCPSGYAPDDPSFHSKLVQNPDESFTVTLSDQTRYKFNVDLQLTSITDKNSNAINYTYDASGKLTNIADTKSHQLTFAYNAQSLISSVTDWTNRKVQYLYDTTGRLTGVTDPNGNTTSYGYDSSSRLTTITDRTGAVVLTNTYNPDARIAIQKNAAGLIKTNTYDNTNKLITQTDTNGRVVKTTYDAKSRILQQTDPLGKSMVYTYSTETVPLTQTDRNGNKTTFTYDSRGNLLSTTFPDNKSIAYTYDNNNRITKVVDNRYGFTPKQIDYTYDASGNQTQKSEAGIITKNTYDSTGEPLTFTDPLNRVSTWTRDTLGNTLTEKDALNNIATFEYDLIGGLKKTTDADGKQFSQTYDANGNVLSLTDAAGTTTNFYDKEDRLIKITLPNNTTNQYAYNSSDSMTSVTDALSNVTNYAYDVYQNLTTQTDALNKTTTNTYDVLNRQTQLTTPIGKVSKWEYDANGNVTKRTDANGITTTYLYDAFNRLTKITYPDTKTVTYAYDNRGNLTQMVDLIGTSTYFYDTFDRLLEAKNAYGQVIKYQYDNADNLLKITYPDNKIVTYTYDVNNRLISVIDWNNKTTTYTYNKNGTVETRTYPNTISTAYLYDTANRLSSIEHKKGITTAAKFVYLRDSVGNITQMTPSGSFFSIPKPTTYTYDALGRLLNHTSEDREGTLNYTYDKVGNILKTLGFSTDRTYAYDADNRLTTLTVPTSGTFLYVYDNNGNVTTKRDVNLTQTFTYDFDNRMTSYKSGTNIKYDGLGNRISLLNQFAVTRRYVTDFTDELPRTIMETEESNSAKAWYLYGLGIISEWNNYSSFSDTNYYLEDGRGNIRFLTSSTGTASSHNVYDGYGNIAWHSGGSPAFKFDAQRFDSDTGLYYLRARYYDPTTGRFISRDPVAGYLQNPLSQHPYQYAYDNPINFHDPSGDQVPPQVVGKIGEFLSQISKNNFRIDSLTKTANYRIPDQLLKELKRLSEVKNVKNLSLSKQLRDFLLFSQKYGFKFELFTRPDTIISGPLRELIEKGEIIHKLLPKK